jgi:predicted  nucleic acid-binding Zn-ribbon protein
LTGGQQAVQTAESAAQLARDAAEAAHQQVVELTGQLEAAIQSLREQSSTAEATASAKVQLEAELATAQGELTSVKQTLVNLHAESEQRWQAAQMSAQAARDAEMRAVQTGLHLADARRALEMTQMELAHAREGVTDPVEQAAADLAGVLPAGAAAGEAHGS